MELLREAQHSLDEFVEICSVYTTKSIAKSEANTTEEISSTPHNNVTNSSYPPGRDEWEQEVLTLDPDDIAEFSVCEPRNVSGSGSSGPGEDKKATRGRSSVDIEDVDGGRVDILMSEVDLTSFKKESGVIDLVTENAPCEERGGEGGWGGEEGVEEAVEGLEDSLKEFDNLIEEFKSPDEFLLQVHVNDSTSLHL